MATFKSKAGRVVSFQAHTPSHTQTQAHMQTHKHTGTHTSTHANTQAHTGTPCGSKGWYPPMPVGCPKPVGVMGPEEWVKS